MPVIYVTVVIINDRDFTKECIEQIDSVIRKQPEISRAALSRKVCEMLDWRGANNRLQEMSCRIALLKLERRGELSLPKAKGRSPERIVNRNKDCHYKIEEKSVSCKLKDIGKVELIRIRSADSMNSIIWNELMNRYHYLGAGPLCGAQMRYLIKGEHHGWLGGLAFSAAAWRLKARDEWIGWSEEARKMHLHQVICNSRFLIAPYVKVAHLASHVLGMCNDYILQDWSERYGYVPLLFETFVERDRFKGTCYKAANWINIGSTCGRGRQDTRHENAVAVKDVYVMPLGNDIWTSLCEEPFTKKISPKIEEKEVQKNWAEEEFNGTSLGDQRLHKRLVRIANAFYNKPQAQVAQACGSIAEAKAAYRFFENPETSMENVLQSHYDATIKRISKEQVVLAVQDTTSFNYSAHPATEDLGPIGASKENLIGLHLHSTLVFTTKGTPLGFLNAQCWARDRDDFGKKHRRKELPIEQKESYKWLLSYSATSEAQYHCPKTKIISVGDRESDIYELFELALKNPDTPKLLARAEYDRLLADGQEHLWDYIAALPMAGTQDVHVPRRGKQRTRDARLEVRFAEVLLKPPGRKPHLPELKVWAILTEETDPPPDCTPLKWMLLTTLIVTTFEEATDVISWYCLRWGIEVFHKTLKSGCKVEQRQLGSADRIEACLAVDMIVAWRIMHLTKLGRETPNVPCTVFFEDAEWKALVAFKTQNPIPPAKAPTLMEATLMVASLGGFLGRKGDGKPGTKAMWLGLQRLDDITETYRFTMEHFAPHLLSKKSAPCVQPIRYG